MKLLVITEFCRHGCLRDYLYEQRDAFEESVHSTAVANGANCVYAELEAEERELAGTLHDRVAPSLRQAHPSLTVSGSRKRRGLLKSTFLTNTRVVLFPVTLIYNLIVAETTHF